MIRDFNWSPKEKKIARAAFDFALSRELEGIRGEVQAMLQRSSDPRDIWGIHDYLSKKRREIDEKYDYRYSVLIMVFGRLVSEGWLQTSDLAGLDADKLNSIEVLVSSYNR